MSPDRRVKPSASLSTASMAPGRVSGTQYRVVVMRAGLGSRLGRAGAPRGERLLCARHTVLPSPHTGPSAPPSTPRGRYDFRVAATGAQKVKKLAQEHTARKQQSPNSNPGPASSSTSPGRFCQCAASKTPGAPKPGSRRGSVRSGGLGWWVYCAGQQEPSRGIPAAETVNDRV